jgi:signal transduction histidine kinase
MTVANQTSEPRPLAFRMHPRVLSALGKDLVTNDVVAVIELVKNSYDALATRVDVQFGKHEELGEFLEVKDNGHGMDAEVIRDVWCVVATPFRKLNPRAESGDVSRSVTGDKGLGRLSAARLGSKLELVTKTQPGPYLVVFLDWDELARSPDLASSTFSLKELESDPGIGVSGTRLRIFDMNSEWGQEQLSELRDNLARLVSPFASKEDFSIFLTVPKEGSEPIEVEAPEFLSKPKYAIRGYFDRVGVVRCKYEFAPVGEGRPRGKALELSWQQIYKTIADNGDLSSATAGCGPFEFEVRAWDLTPDDTLEISDRFDIAKASIRDSIRANKGISLYRDDILVLPKSDDAKDWLGLDLRRVSKVGTRLSTSQIVGYVRITKEANPDIEDTSDRERLASSPAVKAFQEILRSILEMLEGERDQDRRKPEQPVVSLFEELTADDLLAEMLELAKQGASAEEALPMLENFNEKLDRVRKSIQKRFTYYSRLATVGTIAEIIIHEIRNRTTSIARTLRKVREAFADQFDHKTKGNINSAEKAVDALEQLADRFAPLANRSFRRGKRKASLQESIERCLGMLEDQVGSAGVTVDREEWNETEVAVDPGELDSILINLIANALYWLNLKKGQRMLRFRVRSVQGGSRVRISIDDSGPGIEAEDAERIFWPGVTRKPGGIGMGLTVAAELVSEYGGKMALVQPGRLGGATFEFDIPVAR